MLPRLDDRYETGNLFEKGRAFWFPHNIYKIANLDCCRKRLRICSKGTAIPKVTTVICGIKNLFGVSKSLILVG